MLRAHLHRAGIRVVHATTITGISRAVTAAAPGRCGPRPHGDPWSAGCDGVVLVTQQASRRRAVPGADRRPGGPGARPGSRAVYLIGDAVAPRMISEAIFDGHRLAREIDSADPAAPLPYRRERPDLA